MAKPRFVETEVSRLIFDVIEDARENTICAAIVGNPGVGKTMALEAYQASHPKARVVTATAVMSGSMLALFKHVAYELGVYPDKGLSDLQQRLFGCDFTGAALLIDEAQNLPLKAVRELLYLWEKCDLPLIFCGNAEVLKRVNVDHGAFAQISRRVPRREQINGILDSDADAITNTFGVEGMDCYALMRKIGAKFHADGVVQVLTRARRIAAQRSSIRLHDIHDALELMPAFKAALADKRRRVSIQPEAVR
ncbi:MULTISPECIES: AAA family ATPase [Hyphomicrobiales]|jgi:DNA transposition AAA+ family ATPase|uniref:AAA family ATPase n=1 Tax=Methylobacterium sp. CCH7-A2 TaxID=1768789 RepID=UPI000835A74B|nr:MULTISPECIES: AAA family ATPase [Hyphomicrobiales]